MCRLAPNNAKRSPMEYNQLASAESIKSTIAALAAHNIEGMVVENGAAALAKLKELIPAGSSVMNGSSVTLETIGYVDYLKEGKHGWNNLHETIVVEKDPAKQAVLRQQATHADYYLGSVHALFETGEFVIASNTGSQLPHVVFTSKNLIFVVGAQKIVPNLAEAMKRLEEYVIPLEDKRSQKAYGVNTYPNKILFFKGEAKGMQRKIQVLIINEALGF
jgi:L-lactate utilization protein LutC